MYICFFLRPLLGAFAKGVDTVSFVMSVCLSVPTSLRMQQLDSYWADFREILCCRLVLKFAYKFKFWLKWSKSNRHFT
jgi:hypothetical protein